LVTGLRPAIQRVPLVCLSFERGEKEKGGEKKKKEGGKSKIEGGKV